MRLNFTGERVLAVVAHPDDAELGMAGAFLQYKADGFRVGILDLTSGEPNPFGTPEIRARETAAPSARREASPRAPRR